MRRQSQYDWNLIFKKWKEEKTREIDKREVTWDEEREDKGDEKREEKGWRERKVGEEEEESIEEGCF